jgi:hypothetical protein
MAGSLSAYEPPSLGGHPEYSSLIIEDYILGFFLILIFFFLELQDIRTIIETAELADMMGQLHFMALGALDDGGLLQFPVCTTAMFASLGNFPLWKSHVHTSYISSMIS